MLVEKITFKGVQRVYTSQGTRIYFIVDNFFNFIKTCRASRICTDFELYDKFDQSYFIGFEYKRNHDLAGTSHFMPSANLETFYYDNKKEFIKAIETFFTKNKDELCRKNPAVTFESNGTFYINELT